MPTSHLIIYVQLNKLTPSLFALCNISSSLFCTNFSIFCSRLDFVFHKNLPKFCNSNESKCHFCAPAVSSCMKLLHTSFFSSCIVLRYWYGKSLATALSKVFCACRLQLRDKRWGAVSARCGTVTVRWLLPIVTETADVDGRYSLVRERHFMCVGVVSVTLCWVKYCLYTKQSYPLRDRMWNFM
jgi:hypothetical protein